MLDSSTFNHDLLTFLQDSPTPYHAVQQMAVQLEAAGFELLSEADDWQLKAEGSYYLVRNGSSIIAFNLSGNSLPENGMRMVGAHTDSPCLKVKPNPELNSNGYFQLGVEVYGGALLAPWFDRDLSLAGKVNFINQQGQMRSALIDFKRPIATVPSLAIHLDRDANKNRSINPQKDIPPLLMLSEQDKTDFRQLLFTQLMSEHPECKAEKVLDFELCFYDTQPPALIGLKQEFIASARLDNLLSCYIGLQALMANKEQGTSQNTLLVCNDHEEVGSQSANGAQGPMLKSVLSRLVAGEGEFVRAMEHSMMISADNAHGIHPNFSDRHDGNHGPLLNNGPVIKNNANQRYATNSDTSSMFRRWCDQVEQPVQSFVVRTDMACGSTIGPITASGIGVKTLDIGVPTFAMHSIRELAGSTDSYGLYKVLVAYNESEDVGVTAI